MGEMPKEIEREIGNLLECARDTSPIADMLARDLRAAILRALADARRQALDEAAKVAEMITDADEWGMYPMYKEACEDCAAAIRALAGSDETDGREEGR